MVSNVGREFMSPYPGRPSSLRAGSTDWHSLEVTAFLPVDAIIFELLISIEVREVQAAIYFNISSLDQVQYVSATTFRLVESTLDRTSAVRYSPMSRNTHISK